MNALSRRTLILGAIGIVFLLGFGWVVLNQGPLAKVKVTIAQAAEITLDRSIFGIGEVEARHSYAIGPTTPGRIAAVYVDQGNEVTVGQLLAEMDPVDLESRQAAARATAARATELTASAQAALAESESRAKLAQSSAERFVDLARKKFVSQEAVDIKLHEAAAARAGVDAATAALSAARAETRRAQSELAGLGKSRAHLRMTSPIAGVISARYAEAGATVVAGQPIVQVIDPKTVWLRVRIDQGRSSGLASNLNANITLRSAPGKVYAGKVSRLDILGDAIAEERIVNVDFIDMPVGMPIGELAEVTLTLPPLQKALAIPSAAIKRVDSTDGVWQIKDGQTAFTPVVTGARSHDGMTQIVQGLSAGAEVIVYSQTALKPDIKVSVVNSLSKAAP